MDKIKVIVFDLDDTLVATTRCNNRCRKHALERVLTLLPGVDVTRAGAIENTLYKSFGWARLQDIWRGVAIELGVDVPSEDELLTIQRKFGQEFTKNLHLFPTVEYTLKSLADSPVDVGIISDGDAGWQWRKMKTVGIDRFFDPEKVIITIQSDLASSKPSTANFRRQQKLFAARPNECVYIGDKPWDVLAANTAGWMSVRTTQAQTNENSLWTLPELQVLHPDRVINTLSEVLELI